MYKEQDRGLGLGDTFLRRNNLRANYENADFIVSRLTSLHYREGVFLINLQNVLWRNPSKTIHAFARATIVLWTEKFKPLSHFISHCEKVLFDPRGNPGVSLMYQKHNKTKQGLGSQQTPVRSQLLPRKSWVMFLAGDRPSLNLSFPTRKVERCFLDSGS